MLPKLSLQCILNPFIPKVSFLYLLKTSGKLWFSVVFKGCKKGKMGRNRLTGLQNQNIGSALPCVAIFLATVFIWVLFF